MSAAIRFCSGVAVDRSIGLRNHSHLFLVEPEPDWFFVEGQALHASRTGTTPMVCCAQL